MRKIIIFLYLILFVLIFNISSAEIKIKYEIDNQIITNIDIENEKNYLLFLRPELKKLSKKELKKISENSIIREIIKKKELNKIFKNIDNKKLNEQIKDNLLKFKKISTEEELKNQIKEYNIDYLNVIEKMKYERLWNNLISKKYSSLVKINKKKLKDDLIYKMSNSKKFEYNLSELLFEIKDNKNLNLKYKNITEYINENGFKAGASKYSIAGSAKKGGEIGWVKETLLSRNIIKILSELKVGEITKPIKYPNGYLVLKLNKKKEMKQIIDIEKELKDVIRFETNKQLNQFSLLYYKKLKQNIIINEK